MRVRARSFYIYRPVMLDVLHPPYGVQIGILAPGDTVRVVNLHGCPPANTMHHCHIQTESGEFAGMVCTNSLQSRKG